MACCRLGLAQCSCVGSLLQWHLDKVVALFLIYHYVLLEHLRMCFVCCNPGNQLVSGGDGDLVKLVPGPNTCGREDHCCNDHPGHTLLAGGRIDTQYALYSTCTSLYCLTPYHFLAYHFLQGLCVPIGC